MAEEGQILRLGLAGSDDRYDGNIHRHGHVRCRLCGAVADIPPVAMGEPEDTAGYLLEDCAVEYCGLCPDCLNRQKEKPLSPVSYTHLVRAVNTAASSRHSNLFLMFVLQSAVDVYKRQPS